MRGSKGVSEPMMASTDMAPARIAAAALRSAASEARERKRGRNLRAVEKRQSFLGAERHRLALAACECERAARRASPFTIASPSPISTRLRVGKRCQIARGADRALAGNDRQNVGIEEGDQRVDGVERDAGGALREADDFEEQDQPDDRRWDSGGADARRMRAHDVDLQLPRDRRGDARRGELAEAGIDAIDRLRPPGERRDRFAAERDGVERARRQFDRDRPSSASADIG